MPGVSPIHHQSASRSWPMTAQYWITVVVLPRVCLVCKGLRMHCRTNAKGPHRQGNTPGYFHSAWPQCLSIRTLRWNIMWLGLGVYHLCQSWRGIKENYKWSPDSHALDEPNSLRRESCSLIPGQIFTRSTGWHTYHVSIDHRLGHCHTGTDFVGPGGSCTTWSVFKRIFHDRSGCNWHFLAVSQALLDEFNLFSQYSAAAYCTADNTAASGADISCSAGNCPLVQQADAVTVYSFSG